MKQIPLFVILVIFCLLPFKQTNAGEKQADDAPPNILFILIDDMGWKDISCAGSSYYETPNIDKLASEGKRFLNAYSPAPVCTPTRGAIYSGKCPARTQLTTVFNGPAGPDDRLHDKSKYRGERDQYLEARHRHALPRKEIIIPSALAEAGYMTAFFGKWHIGECPGYYPDERGFHVARGYRKQQHGSRSHWMKDFAPAAANMDGADQDAYVADALTTECVNFIKGNKDKPWMAVLSHYLVHSPVQPKPEKLAKYKSKPTTDQNNPGYAAMVESVDESVGRLMQTLQELGLEQNTLVIFTSDNGGLTPKNTSNYPLMGGKSFPFEAGMKVPFIVKWPWMIEPGISDQRVVGMDIYPTMLSAAGLPLRPDQHVDGLDLMPLLTKNESLKKRPIIFHFPHYTHATGPYSSIIEDDWKLIQFYNDEQGAYLLYNLAADPEEQDNLADVNVKMRDKLIRNLEESLQEMNAEMPFANPGFNPDLDTVRKHLRFTKDLADRERILFELRLKNEQKPNVILVFIDDMGWSDLSSFGNTDARTPNIDRLASEGISFEQFYVNSPICSPSRVSISTGTYPQRWNITSYLAHREQNSERGMANWLDPSAPMLARSLNIGGYATGHFGKWHMGGQRDATDAPEITDYGFDESLTNFEGMGAKLLPLTKDETGKVGRIWEKAEILGEPFTWMQRSEITTGFIDAAIQFMEKAQKEHKPFYVNIWPDDVHSPFWPPFEEYGLAKEAGKRGLYLAVLEAMDKQFGKLFDYIQASDKLRDNTLILLCSDNGPELGAGRAGDLKGYKTHLYEGGIRSPLVVWGPAFIDEKVKGTRNKESVFSAIDLTPSLLEFTGTKVPENSHFDGENMMKTILGKSGLSRESPIFYSRPPDRKNYYGFENLPDLAVREGEWKLLCDYDGSRQELYNIVSDPGETRNLAEVHPGIANTMTGKVLSWYMTYIVFDAQATSKDLIK